MICTTEVTERILDGNLTIVNLLELKRTLDVTGIFLKVRKYDDLDFVSAAQLLHIIFTSNNTG